MKNIYIKIAVGIASFGLFFIVDPKFLTETNSIFWYLLCFLLPIILFSKKILTSWVILYILYILSNIYIKFVPSISNNSCWSFCGGETRPLTFFMCYFAVVLVLALLQLRHFVQKKIAEKELRAVNK